MRPAPYVAPYWPKRWSPVRRHTIEPERGRLPMRRAILGTILTSCACWIGYAQSTDPPIAFEVASVKPGTQPTPQDMGGGRMMVRSGGCQGGPGSTDPGRLSCQNVSLSNFISTAYNLKRYQFAFPAWMDDARFDITAKAPAGATKEQLRSMEQNLLAERFKLVIHYEKKEMTVYELIVGKNGPKLKEAVPDPAAPPDSAPPSGPPAIGTLKFDNARARSARARLRWFSDSPPPKRLHENDCDERPHAHAGLRPDHGTVRIHVERPVREAGDGCHWDQRQVRHHADVLSGGHGVHADDPGSGFGRRGCDGCAADGWRPDGV